MDDKTLLSLQAVSLEYGAKRVLHEVSLRISERRIVTLIGPNGAGKTSLVKVALGLAGPCSGVVRRRPDLRVGYMPQRLHIDPNMPVTVARFLALAADVCDSEIQQALAEVDALPAQHRQIHALSGGEWQRVLLARALLRNPHLLVLDEPAQGVDVSGQAELYRLITAIRSQRECGVLLVSHDLHLVMSATDEVICLNQHICCQGHPEQVSNDPAYLDMFGRGAAETLAVYTHRHNHSHGLTGEIQAAEDERSRHG